MTDVTAAAILAHVRQRYARDKGWALFTEVTTGETNRRADALAVNLWTNSRDYQVHGIEVKAARSDWLAELKNPDKSDYFRGRCAYWWIAAGPDVVRPDEVPPGWGLLVVSGSTLRMVKNASALNGTLDTPLMTVLLRHAYDASPSRELLRAERNAGYEQAVKSQEQRAADRQRVAQRALDQDFEEWQRVRPEIEKASGVRIASWTAKVAGRAYGLLYKSKDRERDTLNAIRQARQRLEVLVAEQRRLEAETSKAFGLEAEP